MCSLSVRTLANDSGDAPVLAQDSGADIGDVFFFLDPTDVTQTVIIGTVHGFLVPGKVPDFAAFDENVKFRFEIFNDHVNVPSPILNPSATPAQKAAFLKTIKPNRAVEVTFKKREVGLGPQTGTGGGLIPANLRRPLRQEVTVALTGFSGLNGGVFRSDVNGDALLVSPFNLSPSAPAFDVRNIKVSPTANVQFFAGEVDDPFFMDVPAFNTFIDGIRNGGAPTVSAFARQRDTHAGYNTLAIALRIPTVLLLSERGPFLGLNFVTQRHALEVRTPTGVKGTGPFKTVDRMGNPLVNAVLVPFDKRNAYNGGTPKGDASLQFAPLITETLQELGISVNPPEPSFSTLQEVFFGFGDILQLDTSISNAGSPAGAGFPNGRRLADDTADTILTWINHGSTVSDGVTNSGGPSATFPFLRIPNQPLPTGSGTDDATRN